MQISQTTLALPCETLADLSTELSEQAAGNLLATWTALWHPALLSLTRKLPGAAAADSLADNGPDSQQLVVLPAISTSSELDSWASDEPLVLRLPTFERRSQIISQLAQTLEQELAEEGAADFYALGFAYLQIELLTRSMRYDRDVTQESLRAAVIAAADAAIAGDETLVDKHLADAYDQLMQSRNHYYPIDFYIIDLSLTAPGVVGDPFAHECKGSEKGNVLITGELLEHLANEHPASLSALRDAVQTGQVTACGGTQTDARLADLSAEQLLAEVRAGQATAEKQLGQPLRVFAHREGPLAPLAAGLLYRSGFHAALMSNFSGASLPPMGGSRTVWSGLDNAALEALSAEPLDMGSHSALLGLWEKMQQAMNYDLAASLLLVGWPGHRTEWHADWLRVASRTTLLGRTVTLDEYFDITSSYDHAGTLAADDYPMSKSAVEPATTDAPNVATLCKIAQIEGDTADGLARLLGADTKNTNAGTLWLNASPQPLALPSGEAPPFGWRWAPALTNSDVPPRCELGKLRNEFMEIFFDPTTGGVSATRLHDRRGNQLSQQLLLAPLGAKGVAAGLQLAVDGWDVIDSSEVLGQLRSKFRVVDRDAKRVADVEQLTTLHRNSMALEMEIQFRPHSKNAANCAIASRIAVAQEQFTMTRGLQSVDLPTTRTSVKSQWLGIASEPIPLAILCDAPRLHRRHTGRMIDTTLIESASNHSVVRMSYVVDGRYPAQQFIQWRSAGEIIETPSGPPSQPAGWWLRIAATNVTATHCSTERADGHLVIRLRLLETAGRAVTTKLATWKPIVDAQQVNFLGEPDQLLSVEAGEVRLSLAPYEYVEVVLLIVREG